jgi:transposase InsO family protein
VRHFFSIAYRAVGTPAPILLEAKANARWSLDFVHDQFACGRRFRVLNVVDDVTRECLAAILDTSISGRRVARELTTLIERRSKPGMIVSHRAIWRIQNRQGSNRRRMKLQWQASYNSAKGYLAFEERVARLRRSSISNRSSPSRTRKIWANDQEEPG